ncbi:hypothetical protein ACFLUT_03845 [Chloroflexota bacterium]
MEDSKPMEERKVCENCLWWFGGFCTRLGTPESDGFILGPESSCREWTPPDAREGVFSDGTRWGCGEVICWY